MQEDYQGSEETHVGITQYMIPGHAVPAITKYLLSDFIVNEIDKANHLVVLKHKPDLSYRPPAEKPSFQIGAGLREEMRVLLGQSAVGMVEKLYYQLECGERVGPWEVVLEREIGSKEERKGLHDFVRQRLHFIESQTLESGMIKLRYSKNMRKMNPSARHKYTHFVLYKHGIDTINAIFRLSKATGIPEKLFSSAGLKDKRGHTTQKVSVYNTDLPSLHKFYRDAGRNREMWVQDFVECQDEKIEVGGLSGNQFGLILRLLRAEDGEEAMRRVEGLNSRGMINYFGLQRFGQFSIKTYELGVMCVRKEWQKLVESIILSDCNNFEANNLKRELYQQKKYGQAERCLHNKYKIQKLLFRGLSRCGQNFQNVFESLPRSIKTLYTHSLQSYLWNRVASRRIKEGGLNLMEGDMVGHKVELQQRQAKEAKEEGVQGEIDAQLVAEQGEQQQQAIAATLVTKQNIDKYSIYDLVLPLYGPVTRLQQGSWLHKCFAEQLKALDLQEGDFLHSAKANNAVAAWRRLLVRPQVVEHELLRHGSAKEQLQSPFYTMGDTIKPQQGDLCALRVVVKLPKSAYATMAIRQMLHISSEFKIQKQLNNQYEARYCK